MAISNDTNPTIQPIASNDSRWPIGYFRGIVTRTGDATGGRIRERFILPGFQGWVIVRWASVTRADATVFAASAQVLEDDTSLGTQVGLQQEVALPTLDSTGHVWRNFPIMRVQSNNTIAQLSAANADTILFEFCLTGFLYSGDIFTKVGGPYVPHFL